MTNLHVIAYKGTVSRVNARALAIRSKRTSSAAPGLRVCALALNSGRLLKGGIPDLLAVARHVLVGSGITRESPTSPSRLSFIPRRCFLPQTGAEIVGRAQILDSFSKPFELAGLFGSADAGAFNKNAQMQEVAMDDGEVNNGIPAQESGMVIDDGMAAFSLSLPSFRKRARSPLVVMQVGASESSAHLRVPKRFRRAKDHSAYEEAAARSQNHALNRRLLKHIPARLQSWPVLDALATVIFVVARVLQMRLRC